ncbi:unnamed protein product [Darwinula stevensoni]|uniref:NEDD4-binding protein 2-like 1 n=1 Tax=Darwinula stevensoni TaxID=69355 RepID=A0A7R8WXQ4_9CRUS|nr:unnamed protein product [Darwinula stevensoni]CAG0878633.1 unnamed protein product [Darwinula stevensoni]
MLLLRGCPGSGKTILAKSLKGNGVIHSKDDFFVDQSGDYSFSFDFLDQAHQWNEKCAEESMKKGISPVIIDNTNIETWEMVPYVRLAQLYGYDVMIMEPHTPWKYNVQELSRRNKHGVSRATIRSMLKRYESTTVENLLERASAKNGVESSEEKDCVASLGLFQTSESSSSSQRLDMSDPWQVASGSAGSNKSDGPLPQHEAIRNKDLGVSASLSSMSGDTEVLRDQFSNMGIFSAEQSTNKYVESWIQTNFDKDPETSWLSDTESLEQINKNPLPPNRPWIPKFQRKSARRSATDRIHRSASSGNCSHPKDIFVLSHEKSSSTSWDCVPTPGISWEESHVSKGTGKHPSQSSSALSDCPLPERIKSSRTQKPQNFDSSEASL